MILLTPMERRVIGQAYIGDPEKMREEIAKAQLKKVVEWRNQECTEHNHTINISGFNHKVIVMHNDCEKCWQELLKEAGLDEDKT